MEIEFKSILIMNTTEEQVKAQIQVYEAEGWRARPDVPPVTVMHLMRMKGDQPAVGFGVNSALKIDDDKVLVRSAVDGKLRKADGTIVSEN
jgi:hypothetical protein